MPNNEIREKLIRAGVKNLRQFGYPEVSAENICSDEIYRAFFTEMLRDNLGNGQAIDAEINCLLEEFANATP